MTPHDAAIFEGGDSWPGSDRLRTKNEPTVRLASARAVASVRLEGLEPTDSAKAIFDRYVAGDLTAQEMVAEIQALNAREFRPIHVPGN
jgi:hypothetical protein